MRIPLNEPARLTSEQTDAYLKRIGVKRSSTPNLGFLNELVYAHQTTIAFENLDVFYQLAPISLNCNDLFEKIITRKRGGFCYELNGLFAALLRSLGYEVLPIIVRITMYPNPEPPVSHRSNLVSLDNNLYLVDVGFGGPVPSFALKVEDGFSKTGSGQVFSVHSCGKDWYELVYENSSEGPIPVLEFSTTPFRDYDFFPFAYNHSENPSSSFRRKLNINIRTDCGSRSISAMTYTEHVHDEVVQFEIGNEAELEHILAEKFGIRDWRN